MVNSHVPIEPMSETIIPDRRIVHNNTVGDYRAEDTYVLYLDRTDKHIRGSHELGRDESFHFSF